MPAITIEALNNAQLDVDHIAAIATSDDLTATDRIGGTKLTIAGALETMGYEPPVAYTGGLSISRATQTVTYSGITYSPDPGALPFTTSVWGTDEAKFPRVIQGVTAGVLLASTGAAGVGFDWALIPAAINKVDWGIRTATNAVHVFRYILPTYWADILAHTSTYDAGANINSAIAAAGSGGTVIMPDGLFKTTIPILAEDLRGIKILGSPGQYGFQGTRILASHTGKAALSLVGTNWAHISDIIVEGDTAARPKTGILLGRSSAASAGNHTFINAQVAGYYSVAGVYNVASENNTWVTPTISCNAAPYAAWFVCQGDTYSIGGLTGSSMETDTVVGGSIANHDTTAGSTVIFIDAGSATGHFNYQTFLAKNGGASFVKIRLGNVDGADTKFPINLKLACETATTNPTRGLDITGTTIPRILANLTANLSFKTPATNNIYCDANVYLLGCKIKTAYGSGGVASVFERADGCDFELLSEAGTTTFANLNGSRVKHNSTITVTAGTDNYVSDLVNATNKTPTTIVNGLRSTGGAFAGALVAVSYSASMTPDASLGNHFFISVANTTAFTINAPTNPVDGQKITLELQNNSGGAMGAITWTGIKIGTWTAPATGYARSVELTYSTVRGWRQQTDGSDVAN